MILCDIFICKCEVECIKYFVEYDVLIGFVNCNILYVEFVCMIMRVEYEFCFVVLFVVGFDGF